MQRCRHIHVQFLIVLITLIPAMCSGRSESYEVEFGDDYAKELDNRQKSRQLFQNLERLALAPNPFETYFKKQSDVNRYAREERKSSPKSTACFFKLCPNIYR